MPELRENDITMTAEELKEHEEKRQGKAREGIERSGEQREGTEDKQKEEEETEQESEEEKKEKAAETLGIDRNEIKSVATINPREKITDKETLADLMPEASEYDEVQIVYTNKESAQFTVIGATKDGKTEQINSIEAIEGTTTSKSVISVNEDGSQVSEKQVNGLLRINSRGRNDGISISTGDYGMLNIDYVSNIMDKENRRATPIRTKESENQRVMTSKVRENAGDSIAEMEKEGKIYNAREKEGIKPQTLDGIDTDKADGCSMTLQDLKESIKEKVLEQEDMSKGEMQEFIHEEIEKSGLELSDEEVEHLTEEIETEVLDESRFPTRGSRI